LEGTQIRIPTEAVPTDYFKLIHSFSMQMNAPLTFSSQIESKLIHEEELGFAFRQ
jgi:hypothetical protein